MVYFWIYMRMCDANNSMYIDCLHTQAQDRNLQMLLGLQIGTRKLFHCSIAAL